MEGRGSEDLKSQEAKAEAELLKLPEAEKTLLQPVLLLQKQRNDLYVRFLSELRALEYKYDQQYQPLYAQRSEVAKNTQDFWLKVFKNNPLTATMIFEQDEPLLKHLMDVKYIGEEHSDNFVLEFHFSENTFIENLMLSKKYFIGSDDEIEKTECTEIKWKGANLTQKVKKTKKRGKNKKVGIKVEEIPSFFTFFKSLTEDDEDEDDDSEAGGFGNPLEEDYDTACELRDDVIPNAIYYYLGVRGNEDEDDDDEDEDGSKPKSKKVDGSGGEKADCKPQ